MYRRILHIIIFIIFLYSTQSCIRENRNNCEIEVLLKFRYVGENDFINLRENHYIKLYFYNQQSLLQEVITQNNFNLFDDYSVRIEQTENTFQCISWLGLNTNFYSTSNDEINDNLSNANLQLIKSTQYHVPTPPNNLFWNRDEIEFSDTKGTSTYIINLHRITSDIRIIIEGLEDQISSSHTLTIEDQNGEIRFSDAETISNETIIYAPTYSNTSEKLIADFTVMRLQKNPILKLYSEDGKLQKEWDLIEEILSQYPANSLTWGNDYEIIFKLGPGYLVLSITINGWTIIDDNVM